jgi:hypothetical protein
MDGRFVWSLSCHFLNLDARLWKRQNVFRENPPYDVFCVNLFGHEKTPLCSVAMPATRGVLEVKTANLKSRIAQSFARWSSVQKIVIGACLSASFLAC